MMKHKHKWVNIFYNQWSTPTLRVCKRCERLEAIAGFAEKTGDEPPYLEVNAENAEQAYLNMKGVE